MWCKNCNLETNEAICPVCGLETSEDLPVEIYWCNDCRIPVIHVSTAADKGICPVCHGKTRYLTADLRPVFPEERLLIALLLDKAPDAFMQKSVWATGSRYYIDGKSLSISTKIFETADIDKINDLLEKSADAIDYTFFDENMLDALYRIERLGLIKINRTAGLDVITIQTDLDFLDCVKRFYSSIDEQSREAHNA